MLKAAEGIGDLQEECGDYLFASANLVRMLKVNPELALQDATRKFINRFSKMEGMIRRAGKSFDSLDRDQLLAYWESAK